jgi:glycerophosphoryl diester phosphodiesterase
MKVIAHRGYSEYYPENSSLAFIKAIEAGVDGIETDIRLSCDGVAFINHDSSLKKISGKDEYLEDQNSSYLYSLLGSWQEDSSYELKLLNLDELLELIDAQTVMILEIKYHDKSYKRVCEVVYEAIKDKLSWCEVSSFSDEIIDIMHLLDPMIRLHKLIDDPEVLEQANFNERYSFASYFDIDVALREHPKTKELLQDGNVVFWTVSSENIKESIDLGLYGAMSNDPKALQKAYL